MTKSLDSLCLDATSVSGNVSTTTNSGASTAVIIPATTSPPVTDFGLPWFCDPRGAQNQTGTETETVIFVCTYTSSRSASRSNAPKPTVRTLQLGLRLAVPGYHRFSLQKQVHILLGRYGLLPDSLLRQHRTSLILHSSDHRRILNRAIYSVRCARYDEPKEFYT